jgi:prophage regulatory protein
MSRRLASQTAMTKPIGGSACERQDMAVPYGPVQGNIGTSTPLSTRLITRAELRSIVPYTPQHILRLEKRGLFPRRVQVGANRVAWLLSEVEEWVAARVAERKRLGS